MVASRCRPAGSSDQPSPILCQATGPPSPVCRARASAAARSPRRPSTSRASRTGTPPIGQPWFQARSAIPNAAVDLPLPAPVCTTSSGRLRRCRVVSPSSRHGGRLVPAASGSPPVHGRRRRTAPASGVGGELVQPHGTSAPRCAGEPRRPGPAAPARLAVDDHDGGRRRRQQPRAARGRAAGSRAAGGPAVGDHDQQRAPARVPQPLRRAARRAPRSRPAASGVRPPVGSSPAARRADLDG